LGSADKMVKRPDGLTLIPYAGRALVWDVTVVASLADSDVDRSVTGAGFVAEMAAERKLGKYSSLSSNYITQPVAMENLGVFGESTTPP